MIGESGVVRAHVRFLALTTVLVSVAIAVVGCRTTYTGYDARIDGVLARQILYREDFLWQRLSFPRGEDTYLADTRATIWDGPTDPGSLRIEEGATIISDVAHRDHRFDFTVFMSSGPRLDRPDDTGRPYNGPTQLFTCFGVTAVFTEDPFPEVERHLDSPCPAELSALMPVDAAFATDDVFDG